MTNSPDVSVTGRQPHLEDTTARQMRRVRGSPGASARFLVSHVTWILLVTAVVTGGAAALSSAQHKSLYQSDADVALVPALTATGTPQAPNMVTEKAIASSGKVLFIAARTLGVAQGDLLNGLSVTVPVGANVLQFGYSDSSPKVAQTRAQAIAEAYVAYRSPQAPAGRGTSRSTSRTGSSPGQTTRASIITSASLPTSPVHSSRPLALAAGLLVGLGLGIGTALYRDHLDDALRDPVDFETQAGMRLLRLIPAVRLNKRDRNGPPVTVTHPDSSVAEAYRNLRTLVIHEATMHKTKSVLVTCPTTEGKTDAAANLAVCLAQSGRRVVLVCADLRWRRVCQLFGLDGSGGIAGLTDEHCDVAGALRGTEVPGLSLLPPGGLPADPAAVLQSPAFEGAVRQLQSQDYFVIIDAPPVLASTGAVALGELADMVVLVGDARRSSRTQVRSSAHDLEELSGKIIGCVLDHVGRARRLPRRQLPAGPPDTPAAEATAPGAASAPFRNGRKWTRYPAGVAAHNGESQNHSETAEARR